MEPRMRHCRAVAMRFAVHSPDKACSSTPVKRQVAALGENNNPFRRCSGLCALLGSSPITGDIDPASELDSQILTNRLCPSHLFGAWRGLGNSAPRRPPQSCDKDARLSSNCTYKHSKIKRRVIPSQVM